MPCNPKLVIFNYISMKNNDDKCPWGHILGAIGLIIILIALNCSKSFGQTFNQRDYQKGHFSITFDSDSVYVSESFVFEEAGYKRLWKNQFSEAITVTCEGQMYKDVYTEYAHYALFYCKDGFHSITYCDVYVHPIVGETLHYYNK